MDKIIGVPDLQRRFKAVFDDVAGRGIPYVLTRGSRPEVVMIPYEQYQKFVRVDEAEVLVRFQGLQRRMEEVNREYSEEEIEEDLREATAPCEIVSERLGSASLNACRYRYKK